MHIAHVTRSCRSIAGRARRCRERRNIHPNHASSVISRGKAQRHRRLYAHLVFALFVWQMTSCAAPEFYRIGSDHYQTIDKDEHAHEVELNTAERIYDLDLKPGSRITVDERGELTQIQPSEALTLNDFAFPANTHIFVEETRTDDPILALMQKINPPPLKLKLVKAELGAAATFAALEFQPGDVIQFSAEQKIVSAVLVGPHTFGDGTFADGSEVWFNAVGEVKSSRSKEQRSADDVAYAKKLAECQAACAPYANTPGAAHNDCVARCLN